MTRRNGVSPVLIWLIVCGALIFVAVVCLASWLILLAEDGPTRWGMAFWVLCVVALATGWAANPRRWWYRKLWSQPPAAPVHVVAAPAQPVDHTSRCGDTLTSVDIGGRYPCCSDPAGHDQPHHDPRFGAAWTRHPNGRGITLHHLGLPSS